MKYESAPFEILPATPADITELVALYDLRNDYLASHTNYPCWRKGVYPIRKTAEQALEEHTLFVLKSEGTIAGSLVLNHAQEEAYQSADWGIAANGTEVLVVHTLVVHPEYAGQGIAKALMHFAEQYGRNLGCLTIRLDTAEGNQPAMALYEKLGYRFVGKVDLKLPYKAVPWYHLFELIL